MANISDEKVIAATSKSLQDWFELLDKAGAKEWKHKEMADWLWENHLPKPWWCQMVVVEYEQARGLRQPHERPDGFEISASKTFDKPLSELYEILKKIPHAIWTTDNKNKNLRGKYFDTSLEVAFYLTPSGKNQAVISQSKISSAKDADHMKTHWKQYLESLLP